VRCSIIGIGSLALVGGLALAQQQPQQQPPAGGGTGHVRTGAQAPNVNLFDLKGQTFVLEFINPTDEKWVELYEDKRLGKDGKLKETRDRYKAEGIIWLAICPYESTTGQAAGGAGSMQGIARMDRLALRRMIEELDLDFPVLFDEGGKVMKSFGITAVPHVVIVDKHGRIAYSERLRGESGELVGLDTFDRAVGDAINVTDETTGTLPAGAPRQNLPEQEHERLERERLERERLERGRR
jgi:hypothetical protein